MFKRIMCALVIVMVFASLSFGSVEDFGDFTVDVPSGWSTSKNDKGSIIFRYGDTSTIMLLTFRPLRGETMAEVAQSNADSLNGTKPRYNQKTGTYRFVNMTESSRALNVMMRGFEDKDTYCLIIWEATSISRQVEKVITSIKIK